MGKLADAGDARGCGWDGDADGLVPDNLQVSKCSCRYLHSSDIMDAWLRAKGKCPYPILNIPVCG